MSDGVIGTLRDPSLPPKTARYPAEWTRTLMRQAGWWPSDGHCYLTCYRLCGDPALGRSFRYVEGWVWNPAAPTAVRHTWLEDTDGRILDPKHPESLVYEMRNGKETLVAAMYMLELGQTFADVPDIGGPLTQWHVHRDLCLTDDPVQKVVSGLTSIDAKCPSPTC